MKRLLCIVSSMGFGGAETFLMKIYRNLDKSKYQMDFIVSSSRPGHYDNEIKSMGGKMFYVPPKSKGVFKSFFGIQKVVKDNRYSSVLRMSDNAASVIDILAAKIGGATTLGVRSTNSKTPNDNFKEKLAHLIFKPLMKILPNIKIANSSEGAKFMFGEKCLINGKAKIFPNSLDVQAYGYDEKERLSVRNEFGILNNDILIGHIGRFTKQKNHRFLIRVFTNLIDKNDRYKLMLVGEGPLENDIKLMVENDDKLRNKVIFAELRSDIPSILSSFDVLVFPSLYEGMPNVVIEAQASGLPCVISKSITKEVVLAPNIYMLSTNDDPESWASFISHLSLDRNKDAFTCLKSAGYDISDACEKFINLFYA